MTSVSGEYEEQYDVLTEEIALLTDPATYGVTDPVTMVETHKSFVFLAGQLAFKLKRSIRYDSIDFRPLEARHRSCLEEVRLNRRLAPDVYLDTVPLTREAGGRLALDGGGKPVDWLVKMRRLPSEAMMDMKIRAGTLHVSDVERIGTTLADFYRRAEPVSRDGESYTNLLRHEIAINERDLVEPESDSTSRSVRTVLDLQLEFLRRHDVLFNERARAGHIVEGHGDLRPEHICLLPKPAIIDCLEFDPRLRVADPVDEIAFLSLECDLLGAAWIRPVLFDVYVGTTGDTFPEDLIAFYTSYRATTWARLAVWRAREVPGKLSLKWVQRKQAYLNFATTFAQQFS